MRWRNANVTCNTCQESLRNYGAQLAPVQAVSDNQRHDNPVPATPHVKATSDLPKLLLLPPPPPLRKPCATLGLLWQCALGSSHEFRLLQEGVAGNALAAQECPQLPDRHFVHLLTAVQTTITLGFF